MAALVLGLLLFLGMHSVRIFAEGLRTTGFQRLGEQRWKFVFSLVSIAGFVLVLWGFSLARQNPVVLWPAPPVWVRHVAALLTAIAFVLVTAAYVPGNLIQARLRHPMVLGTKVWAFAHLVANNTLADLVLFGAFLAWAVLDFAVARRRDRRLATVQDGTAARTAVTVVVGLALWAVFAFWLHRRWLGVAPLGA
ncbi:MAG TPA: NnrU family protein [Ramlibacter sp.]|nr:NnrU family protein [Ramlibacter sp.]